jgi:multidrug resistance protein, MATE family
MSRVFQQLFKLSIPIVLVNVGHMALQVTDLAFLGRVSPEAMAAVGTGSSIFAFAMVVGFGILAGLDTISAQSIGRQDPAKAFCAYANAVIISTLYATAATLVLMITVEPIMNLVGANPAIVQGTCDYLIILAPSIIPMLIFQAGRQFLQACGHERIGMWVMLIGLVLNFFLDWVLVLGWRGIGGYGITGAALATLSLRIAMAIFISWYILNRFRIFAFSYNAKTLKELIDLGIPAAAQMLFEISAFAVATLLASRFSPEVTAAHQIVLNIASVTFMVPLGISSAAAVMVGQAIGRESFEELRKAANASFVLGICIMAITATCFATIPRFLVELYTSNQLVIQAAIIPMLIAAAFQVFDGIQVVGAGVLRGAGITKISAIINGIGHWLIGLPLGILFAFEYNYQIAGLWLGLALGLAIVAILMLLSWHLTLKNLAPRVANLV